MPGSRSTLVAVCRGLLATWVVSLCGIPLSGRAEDAALSTESLSTASLSPAAVAAKLDQLIEQELQAAGVTVAGPANDEDFLRRVSFDIAGLPPKSREVTLFGLNPDPEKRSQAIAALLGSEDYGRNWSTYWRDVVYMSATNTRARGASAVFERWMVDQLNQNRPWSAIVTDLLTATGDISENGATGLLFAHAAQPEEVAAEASRIFLGIQIQCANCHDHPSDIWKREQFHELAAYFPRTALRPIVVDGQQRGFEVVSNNQNPRAAGNFLRENPERLFALLDRNRDQKLTKAEVQGNPQAGMFARLFDRVLENGDTDKDGALSLAEFRKLEFPNMPGRGSSEYFMPNLQDPSSRGTVVHPKFFVDGHQPATGLSDEARRQSVAASFTSPENPWFARALINRVWNEMLGEGFYMPVDDLGPTRTPVYPEVIDALAEAFVAQNYDVKWLIQTIATTRAYQREVRPRPVSNEQLPFAAQTPTRLRSDQVYQALESILGLPNTPAPRGTGLAALYGGGRSPRNQFNQIFAFDPSTPQADITGSVQQALFLMNNSLLRGALTASGGSRLSQILRTHTEDDAATSEVYLLILSREPSAEERATFAAYRSESADRNEAYEDLFWSLLNSAEFLSRR